MKDSSPNGFRYLAQALTSGLFIVFFILASRFTFSAQAQQQPSEPMLIPIGGGYTDIYPGFIEAAIANAHQDSVNILILPIPFASDPQNISHDQRRELLQAAENRRFQMEEACNRSAPTGITCTVTLAPILVREDTSNPANLELFTRELSAIFILGGDPTIAMQVIGGTQVEQALFQAYNQGVIVAGTGAGGGVLSPAMIAGYKTGFTTGNSLDFGAIDVWNTSERHGLVFGLQGVILETQFYQLGRFGRLLNALSLPDSPHIGIGVDTYTGFLSPQGNRLENLFGLYNVTVLDARTYNSAYGVQYRGPMNTLSMRNVLVHVIPPGNFAYDLEMLTFTRFGVAEKTLQTPSRLERSFDAFRIPSTAGTLLVSGDLSADLENNPILDRFIQLAGGDASQILVFADGYPSALAAELVASKYRQALGREGPTVFIDPEHPALPTLPNPEDYRAILYVAGDQSMLHVDLVRDWLKMEWLMGKPILADNAAAASLGQFYAAHASHPAGGEELEAATQKSFIRGNTTLQTGLGLLPVTIEPQVLIGNRWGRLFSLAYNHPDLLAIGLNAGLGVEIQPEGAVVLGDGAIFALDLRTASLDVGANNGFAIANALLDVFASGDQVEPQVANILSSYTRAPTPFIPTPTNTLSPTATPPPPTQEPTRTPRPSNTPRPTPTPLTVPPPSNPDTTYLMVFFGTLMVLVVIFGIWINRKRVF